MMPKLSGYEKKCWIYICAILNLMQADLSRKGWSELKARVFLDEKERELFRLLIGVSGIGPNTARVMLSSLNSDELVKAIRDEDLRTINAIKGIGNKTAQRVIVDLKDKVQKWDYSSEISNTTSQTDNKNREQALLALQTLGFNKIIIEKTLDKILKEDSQTDVENLIKEALKRL